MPEVKFLGMHITENLSWHAHICCLCHSLSKTFSIIKSVKSTQVTMCFGTFTSPTFIRDLGRALYFVGV